MANVEMYNQGGYLRSSFINREGERYFYHFSVTEDIDQKTFEDLLKVHYGAKDIHSETIQLEELQEKFGENLETVLQPTNEMYRYYDYLKNAIHAERVEKTTFMVKIPRECIDYFASDMGCELNLKRILPPEWRRRVVEDLESIGKLHTGFIKSSIKLEVINNEEFRNLVVLTFEWIPFTKSLKKLLSYIEKNTKEEERIDNFEEKIADEIEFMESE